VAAGDADAEKQIAAFVSTVLSDSSVPEDERVGVLLHSGHAAFFKKVGMRFYTEGTIKLREEFETARIENMRTALKQFPFNSLIFRLLVAVAQRSTGERQKELALEIIHSAGAPPGVKMLAGHILKGTEPY
jgi:hypothetical protein